MLTLRTFGPCRGLWHIPGGTVRFGEPLVDAVARVARDELGVTVAVGDMLGYIEYPSHYENGLDCPVGIAFAAEIVEGETPEGQLRSVRRAAGRHARRTAAVSRKSAPTAP